MVTPALIMVVLAVPMAAVAHDETPEKPAMTVTAHGHMSLAADTAFVTVGMETTGRTVADAQRQNRLAMNKVVERLKALQIDNERIQTTSFNVSPQYKPPAKRSDSPAGPPEIIGYVVSNTMTIEVRDVERVGAVIEESLAAGANQFHNLHWALRDERQPKLEALRQAASNARDKATALSDALKVKLIRLLTVSEDSHVVRPVAKVARSRMALEAGGPEMPVFSGEIKVDATVTLVYEMGQE
jgi:uncharacterized protein YggE